MRPVVLLGIERRRRAEHQRLYGDDKTTVLRLEFAFLASAEPETTPIKVTKKIPKNRRVFLILTLPEVILGRGL